MNKKLLLIILCSLGLILTSCADKVEVEKLGLVNITVVGRDSKTNNYQMGVQIVSPKQTNVGTGGSTQELWTVSASGETLMKATKNLRSRVSKKLAWYHSNLIIIEAEIAKEGLDKIIDFFASNQEIRYNSWILIYDGTADDFLRLSPRFEGSMAQELEGIVQNYKEWSNTYVLNLKDMLIRLADQDFDEVTGRITDYSTKLSPEGTYQQENLVAPLKEEDKKIIALSSLAVFKDGKLKGYFDRVETRGYLWITGEIKRGTLVITPARNKKLNNHSKDVEFANNKLAADLLKSACQLKPEIKNGEIRFKLNIKTNVQISEKPANFDLTKTKNIKQIEKQIANKIKQEIKASLEKGQQEYGADIYGYGNLLYRKYPQVWEEIKYDWKDIFPTIATDIKIKVTIKRLGMLSNPVIN